MKSHQKLFEIVSADFFTEGTRCGNEVKKFASRNQLLGDVSNFGLFSVLVRVDRIFFKVEVLNEVRMVKLLCFLKLCFAKLDQHEGVLCVFLKDL